MAQDERRALKVADGEFLVGNNCVAAWVENYIEGGPHPTPFAWSFMPARDFVEFADDFGGIDWRAQDYTPRKVTPLEVRGVFGGIFTPMNRDTFWEMRFRSPRREYRVLFPRLDFRLRGDAEKFTRRFKRLQSLLKSGVKPLFLLAHDNATGPQNALTDAEVAAFTSKPGRVALWGEEAPSKAGKRNAIDHAIPKLERLGHLVPAGS